MVRDTSSSKDAYTHKIWDSFLEQYKRYAPDTIILKTRSEVMVKVTVTQKWYATLRHPKMYPYTKFGVPTSKNIGDMDLTQKREGRTDWQTDWLTDGRMDSAITIMPPIVPLGALKCKTLSQQISQWENVDVPTLEEDARLFSECFIKEYGTTTHIATLWQDFKDGYFRLVTTHIHTNMSSTRFSHSQVNRNIHELSKRKKRASCYKR